MVFVGGLDGWLVLIIVVVFTCGYVLVVDCLFCLLLFGAFNSVVCFFGLVMCFILIIVLFECVCFIVFVDCVYVMWRVSLLCFGICVLGSVICFWDC